MPNRKESPVAVDWKELERLLKLMEEHGLEECEYTRGDLRIRLKKPGAAPLLFRGASPAALDFASPSRESSAMDVGTEGKTDSMADSPSETASNDHLHIVKSPIVGTYYEAPNPGSPPFVHPGDVVKTGQVLCIVEAMKLMNEIEADASGKLIRVFMKNGQPVEYGQPLFALQPDGQP